MRDRGLPIITEMEHMKNESGIIINWLIKIVVLLAVIGVVGFDAGAIIVNNVTLSSSATDVAVEVSITVDQSTTSFFPPERVYDLAVEVVDDPENGIEGARVLRRGTEVDEEGVVHIRLRRKTDTIVAEHIGPLEKYTVSIVNGQAGSN
jgi:hypothetical protein